MRTTVVTTRRQRSLLQLDPAAPSYWPTPQVTLNGGGDTGVIPCHATVIMYSFSGSASTQPRPPSIAPALSPPAVNSAAPCSALHHCPASISARVAMVVGHTMPAPSAPVT